MTNIEMNFSANGNSIQNNKITSKEIEKLLLVQMLVIQTELSIV